MPDNLNWWLMGLSALVGAVLTWFARVRTITREVPVTKLVHDLDVNLPSGNANLAAGAAVAGAGALAVDKLTPNLDVDAPNLDVNTPSLDVDAPSLDVDAPNLDVNTPNLDVDAPNLDVDAPNLDVDAPNLSANGDISGAAVGATGAATLAGGLAANSSADVEVGNPNGWTIKGNEDSMLYHSPESPWYGRTKAEVWFETEAAAERAGFKRWDSNRDNDAVAFADFEPGPYGAGSLKPKADGTGPDGWIKGNEDSMLYHSPESPWYGRTNAEVWFETEAAAERAGFKRWDSNR